MQIKGDSIVVLFSYQFHNLEWHFFLFELMDTNLTLRKSCYFLLKLRKDFQN